MHGSKGLTTRRKKTVIRARKIKNAPIPVFLATTFVVFFLSLSAADSIGFVPDYIDGSQPIPTDVPQVDDVPLSSLPQLGDPSPASTPAPAGALPESIQIPSVGIDLPVQNPATTDVDTLDALLQNGPARYSASAELGQGGNVIIFAHSSHLPIVHNKMFQAFNQIPNVQPGATITLKGDDGKTYVYSVDSVVKADTEDGTEIPLNVVSGAQLTLVTCDTLTGKSARFILTADFVGTD